MTVGLEKAASSIAAVTSSDTSETSVSARGKYTLFITMSMVCLLGFAMVGLLPHVFYHVFSGSEYLAIHLVAEFISIIISFMVFVVGWYGYSQNANKRDLYIGALFLAVGLIDFMHALAYKGMPEFLSPNTVSKASTFWVMARIIAACGLLAAAFIDNQSKGIRWRPPAVLTVTLLLVGVVVVVVGRYPGLLPPMFIDGMGQTSLKITLEWVIIVLLATSIFAFQRRTNGADAAVLLQLAILVSIFSELSFTLYKSAFDTYNLLGHVYKVIAYYLIFRSLFVSSFQRPYRELVQARDRIEQSFGRIGTALSSGESSDAVLSLVAELASEMLGSAHAAVMLLRDGELRIQAQKGMSKAASVVDLRHTCAGEAVRTMQTVVTPDVNAMQSHDPDCHCQQLEGAPAKSVVTAPVMSDREVLGVVEVYSPEANAFGQREAELLTSFARQAAIAIHNSINRERDRAVAETLQRSLLPSPPTVPGLDIAVRYEPADNAAKVGGDLYDVFPLDEDHLAIVIGDVCGHGLEAASTMAMTQYTIKGFMLHGMSPDGALQHANVVLCRSNDQKMQFTFVTALVGLLDIPNKILRFSNAGHHMPISIGEETVQPDMKGDIPIGVDESETYALHTLDLSRYSGVLLYTDGVVEARRKGEMFSIERLCDICGEMQGDNSENMVRSIVDRARAWSGAIQDDIALLAVKWG